MKPRPIRWWWDPGSYTAHARRAFKRGPALCGWKLSPRAQVVGDFPRCAACVDVALGEVKP